MILLNATLLNVYQKIFKSYWYRYNFMNKILCMKFKAALQIQFCNIPFEIIKGITYRISAKNEISFRHL